MVSTANVEGSSAHSTFPPRYLKTFSTDVLRTGNSAPPSFPLFLDLPLELRLKIWQFTLQPRVILCRRRSRPRVPPLLHICRESREEGLRHYKLTYWEPKDKLPVYVNVESDTLFATSTFLHDTDYALETLGMNPAVEQVHHLALSRGFWERMFAHPIYDDLYLRIRGSKVLKSITIVWHTSSVLLSDEPRLVEDGWKEDLDTAEEWRLEMQESQADHPAWNSPVLRFARVEDENL